MIRVPLSLAQEQVWRWRAKSPESAWNDPVHFTLAAPVDREALGLALAFMVERHEGLRTAFPTGPDGPYQSIAPSLDVELPVSDRSNIPLDEVEPELLALISSEQSAPFEVTTPPLFRVRLVQLEGGLGDVVATFDHLISDTTSVTIFMSETRAAYFAFLRGEKPEFPPLDIQYADFSLWQRQWLNERALQRERNYWREKLKGAPPARRPFDRSPDDLPTFADFSTPSEYHEFGFPPPVRQAVEEAAQASGSTPFMVLEAAVTVLLSVLTGATDILMTTTVSGRDRQELEGIIGCFAVLGVLRSDLSGDPTLAEVVERSRDTVLGLFEHHHVPLSEIVADLRSDGTSVNVAAIPVDIEYYRVAYDRWQAGVGVVLSAHQHPIDRLEFPKASKPLAFEFLDDGERLWGTVGYQPRRFERRHVQQLSDGLERLLVALAERPQHRLSAVPTLLK